MYTLTKIQNKKAAFTLTEIMVAVSIFSTVVAGSSIVFAMGLRAYRLAVAAADSSCQTSTTMARMAYGIGNNCGLRAAFTPVTTSIGNNGWNITFSVPKGISGNSVQVNQLRYDKSAMTISFQGGNNSNWTIIGKNIVESTIAATATSVQITISSRSIAGNNSTVNEMISTIAYRN